MISQSLNGKWTLYYAETGEYTIDDYGKFDSYNIPCVEATVPGNVELDLSKAGILPEDLFMGTAINEEIKRIETWEWWYKTEFSPEEGIDGATTVLNFEAVDCIAEYYLNGTLLGTSENAFIGHKFDVAGRLKDKNVLIVHIRSAVLYAHNMETANILGRFAWVGRITSNSLIRKPGHCFGWDIMPRAVSAGIWRGVTLENHDAYEITDMYMFPDSIRFDDDYAILKINLETNLPLEVFRQKELPIVTVKAVCKDSVNERRSKIAHKSTQALVELKNLKLWWPRGYGDQNIYDVTVTVSDSEGNVLCTRTEKYAVRTVELHNDEVANNIEGRFAFIINGVEVYCQGSNWVPLNPYHSMDADKYEDALGLFYDCGCNIVRCWGGNVYEDHRFYELCEEYGIMVWQDFSMACSLYPQEQWFYDIIEEEVTYIVKKLRNHGCIILWAGDNENDSCFYTQFDPNLNKINRKIIPELLNVLDRTRPYLPSSPYLSEKVYDVYKKTKLPISKISTEAHCWGPRSYYKDPFYLNTTASFISESGYHGCPSPTSIKKFITPENVFPYFNKEWYLHSTDQHYGDGRVYLMHNQILELFGITLDNLEDFSLASQITQAEAKKFFIERLRAQRPRASGIIWWNMLDGWPQMSDAVVDYYLDKKLAYYYIKKAQRDFSLFFGEIAGWTCSIYASNCTLTAKNGRYKITCVDDGKVYAEGSFSVKPNANKVINTVKVMYSDKKLFIIEWTLDDGTSGKNHYLAGMPPFDYQVYKNKYLPAIMEDVNEYKEKNI